MSNRAAEWTAEAIKSALETTGVKKTHIAEVTGIPYSTLNRKLAGKADFTLGDILAIAEALGVSPATLTPPAMRSTDQDEAAA